MTTRTRARRVVLRAMLLLCLLAVAYVASVAGRIWWTARQDARPESDAIVVLGASQFDGQPSPVFEARLEHAQALYESGLAPRIVTVGGKQPDDRVTEAAAGQSFLIESGVPDDAVVAVESGDDTVSSLSAVHQMATEGGWDSIILVTDPWHEFRALRIAGDVGFEAAGSPARAGPAVRTRETQARYIARETGAYIWYRLFGGGGSEASAPGAV